MLLDRQRLEDHLQARLTQLTQLQQAEEDRSVRLRLTGAIRGLERLIPELGQFEAGRADRTPVDEIQAPAKQLVRQHARGTSWEAALDQTSEKRQRMYRAIYLLLTRVGSMTDHELRQEMTDRGFEHSWSGVSARRVELERAGWVRDSGLKRQTEFGKNATVWEAVPEDA